MPMVLGSLSTAIVRIQDSIPAKELNTHVLLKPYPSLNFLHEDLPDSLLPYQTLLSLLSPSLSECTLYNFNTKWHLILRNPNKVSILGGCTWAFQETWRVLFISFLAQSSGLAQNGYLRNIIWFNWVEYFLPISSRWSNTRPRKGTKAPHQGYCNTCYWFSLFRKETPGFAVKRLITHIVIIAFISSFYSRRDEAIQFFIDRFEENIIWPLFLSPVLVPL